VEQQSYAYALFLNFCYTRIAKSCGLAFEICLSWNFFAAKVWNALTGCHCWAGVERLEGFIYLVFIHGISLSTDHDCVYIVVLLSNGHTLLNLHNSFAFFPISNVAHAAVHSMNILW